jgi:predicted nucleotidyltransferase
METTTQAIKPILKELQSELRKIYGQRLQHLILYGSYARGDATEDSDIDVIAVVKGIENPMIELEKLSGVLSRISLKHDTLISLHPISLEDFEQRSSPLLLTAKSEGVSL